MPTAEQQFEINMLDPEFRRRQQELSDMFSRPPSSLPEGEQRESQKELWKELFNHPEEEFESGPSIEYLTQNWILTRKPPHQ
jgi:hypothetical protein